LVEGYNIIYSVILSFAIGIMSMYGLLEHFEDGSDPKNYKQHKAFNST